MGEKNLYLILGAIAGIEPPKICNMSIYQIGWADCQKP